MCPVELACGIIVTSDADIEPLVDDSRFRADLFYLLSAFKIELPPLRQRGADIPLLVDYFVKRFSHVTHAFGNEVFRVSADALHILQRYQWPGNIDQLQSVLKRALVDSKGAILACDYLHDALADGSTPGPSHSRHDNITNWDSFANTQIESGTDELYAKAVHEMERRLLDEVLRFTGGNQAHASRILGITRGNLRKKIRTQQIDLRQFMANRAS